MHQLVIQLVRVVGPRLLVQPRRGVKGGPQPVPVRRHRTIVAGAKEGDGFLMAAQCIFDTRLDLGFGLERAKGIEPS